MRLLIYVQAPGPGRGAGTRGPDPHTTMAVNRVRELVAGRVQSDIQPDRRMDPPRPPSGADFPTATRPQLQSTREANEPPGTEPGRES
jgi:hypothetical protein